MPVTGEWSSCNMARGLAAFNNNNPIWVMCLARTPNCAQSVIIQPL